MNKPIDLHPDVAEFARALRRAEAFLRAHGDTHWSAHIARCADEVERSDGHGLKRFYGLFGGMGSLNDYSIQDCEDHTDWAAATQQLQELLGQAHACARKLQHRV